MKRIVFIVSILICVCILCLCACGRKATEEQAAQPDRQTVAGKDIAGDNAPSICDNEVPSAQSGEEQHGEEISVYPAPVDTPAVALPNVEDVLATVNAEEVAQITLSSQRDLTYPTLKESVDVQDKSQISDMLSLLQRKTAEAALTAQDKAEVRLSGMANVNHVYVYATPEAVAAGAPAYIHLTFCIRANDKTAERVTCVTLEVDAPISTLTTQYVGELGLASVIDDLFALCNRDNAPSPTALADSAVGEHWTEAFSKGHFDDVGVIRGSRYSSVISSTINQETHVRGDKYVDDIADLVYQFVSQHVTEEWKTTSTRFDEKADIVAETPALPSYYQPLLPRYYTLYVDEYALCLGLVGQNMCIDWMTARHQGGAVTSYLFMNWQVKYRLQATAFFHCDCDTKVLMDAIDSVQQAYERDMVLDGILAFAEGEFATTFVHTKGTDNVYSEVTEKVKIDDYVNRLGDFYASQQWVSTETPSLEERIRQNKAPYIRFYRDEEGLSTQNVLHFTAMIELTFYDDCILVSYSSPKVSYRMTTAFAYEASQGFPFA